MSFSLEISIMELPLNPLKGTCLAPLQGLGVKMRDCLTKRH